MEILDILHSSIKGLVCRKGTCLCYRQYRRLLTISALELNAEDKHLPALMVVNATRSMMRFA